MFSPTFVLLSKKKSHRSLVRSDSEWRTLFCPAEHVGAGGSDLHWSNLEKDWSGAFHPKVANLVHDLVVPWIRNQKSKFVSLDILKGKSDKWDQFEDHFFQEFFFFFWDLWWSYLEINGFSLQSSWVLPTVKITKKAQSWYGKIRCEVFFGKKQLASFVAFCFSTSPEGKPQCFAGVVDDGIGMI